MSLSAVRSLAVPLVTAALLVSGLPPGAAPAAAQAFTADPATVFINEFHYDNGGTDSGEFVEIAGPAGTDLTGWSIELYNGSGGARYDADPLTGTIPDQQNGFGTVSISYPENGIQNGAPDGIALVNGTTVVQFLSYEGSFQATSHTAAGMTSTNIGVSESGSEAPGLSLQLQGSGTTYQDFTWTETPIAQTQNLVNTGQSFTGPDSAPTVSSTDPEDGETEASSDTDITITFNEPVTVADGWYSIECSATGSHTATESGGPTTFTLDPDVDFAMEETCTVTVQAEKVTDQDTDDPPDAMAADHEFTFTIIGDVCADPSTRIHDVQGRGGASPLEGQEVSVQGVVTGDFGATDGSGLSGFFIQDRIIDNTFKTSEGIFVFVPDANELSSIDVAVGDEVRVRGEVKEFNTFTEIDFVDLIVICSSGHIIPPTLVDLPAPLDGDLERYESMLIKIRQTLTVGQNFFLGRYGQLSLSSQGRLFQPTNSLEPGSPEFEAARALNARRLLILDDGRSGQNPNPIPYIGEDDTNRAGDTVRRLIGNLDFGQISSSSSIRDYRLQPTVQPRFERTNPRPEDPPDVGGNVTVASFNVLNYFTTIDEPGAACTGPDPDPRDNCRGADSPAEFERQKTKIVEAIVAIDADVVGLIEIENNGDVAVQDLVDGLNAEYGSEVYAAVAEPATGAGDDAIRQALIYKPATLGLVGASLSDTDPAHDRPPIAQTFAHPDSDEVFSVIVNHFKSKSCGDATGLDEDQGDGQACYNARRVAQADALIDFIDEVTTSAGDEDVLVIGDLNAYGAEDPIDLLRADGLVDQLARYNEDPYTFIFDGQSGYLDHGLSSASLTRRVKGAAEWHINADEPSVIDYNTEFKPQDLYQPDPFRSSDHDPVILGLRLRPRT